MKHQWIACAQQMPPLPPTPFKVYLVWMVQQIDGATGMWTLLQFIRDTGDWLVPWPSPSGAPQIVTHWCDALDILGEPTE